MSRAAAPPSLQERKHHLVRSAIWDAATDLFIEKGYDETTVDEIAERAGISRRSFFRYFASKSDLFASGTVEYGASIAGAINACPPKAPVAEVVRRTVMQVAGQVTTSPHTRKVMQILAKYPAAREALHTRSAELRQRVEAAYAARGGHFRRVDSGILTGLTLAVLDVVFHHWFRNGEPDIRRTVDQVLAAMGLMALGSG